MELLLFITLYYFTTFNAYINRLIIIKISNFAMYCYLYCITKILDKIPDNLTGIGSSTVGMLNYREITAIISYLSTKLLPVTNENGLIHAGVIEVIQKEQTVLPMRYSSILKDKDGVHELLKNRYSTFVSDLERLHDKLEMGLRIALKENPYRNECFSNDSRHAESTENNYSNNQHSILKDNISSTAHDEYNPNPGIAYLERQRTNYTSLDNDISSAQDIISICIAHFKGVYMECLWDTRTSSPQIISINYLIHKDSLSEFKIRFQKLKTALLKDFQFLCSGPWSPYHFVSP